MSEKQTGNNIDEIFKKAIEPVNTEPSDEFWRKAAEDVISRGSKLNEKKASRWRAIAFILGAGLLMVGYFAYKMENGLKNVEQQITAVKNAQNQNPEKANGNINKKDNDSPAAPVSNNNQQLARQSINTNKENSAKYSTPSIRAEKTGNDKYASSGKTGKPQTIVAAFNKKSYNNSHHKTSVEPPVNIANNKIISETKQPQANASNENTANNTNASEISSTGKPIQKSVENGQTPEYAVKANTQTSVASIDSSKPLQSLEQSQTENPSRFSLSAFFSPEIITGYNFKNNDLRGSQVESVIKSEEKRNFSFSAGTKLEYELSSCLSISAGIGYQTFSFNFNPGVIYAQKQSDGDVGYSITTSSGVVECPYYYGAPKVGDSLTMNTNSTRRYLEIPLQLKYAFINKAKYKLYLNGGIEANVCLGESTTMNWQDYWNNSGVATVNSTVGSSAMYFSYYVGMGADYKICKHISLYAEPGFHNAISSIDNNTPVVSYPWIFSLTTGMIYRF